MELRKILEQEVLSNAADVTARLLRELDVPVTRHRIREQVEKHPDYPSLFSISESLSKWNVDHAAIRIGAEELDSLPVPFVAHQTGDHGRFVLVHRVNGSVEYTGEDGKRRSSGRPAFLRQWSGVVLLAEKNAQSGQQDYKRDRQRELLHQMRVPLLVLLTLAAFAGLSAWTALPVAGALLGATLVAGTLVSALLLWMEFDKSNPYLQHFCQASAAGGSSGCNAVLESEGAKVPGIALSWSEVGSFYFFGGTLALLLTGSLAGGYTLLAWLSTAALPFTIFSIYYQWRIVKQWCTLCLAAQAMLLAGALTSVGGYWLQQGMKLPSAPVLLLATIGFVVPAVAWSFLRGLLEQGRRGKELLQEHEKFKFSKEVFQTLRVNQKDIGDSADGLGIVVGDPSAPVALLKACNPYCGPCAKAHEVLEELIATRSDVRLQMVFNAAPEGDERKAKPVRHFLAIAALGDQRQLRRALHDWYSASQKDYDRFAAKYPVAEELLAQQNEQLRAMHEWCRSTAIAFTPTLFIDGRQLPKHYTVRDIAHLV